MTYLITDYSFDFFDLLLVWRIQTLSLLTSMSTHDYEQAAIDTAYDEIRKGTFNSFNYELLKVREIYIQYKNRENFHILFNRILFFGCSSLLILVAFFIFRWQQKKKDKHI